MPARRQLVLCLGALALLAGACATTDGAAAPTGASVLGIGSLPGQAPLAADGSPGSIVVPTSIVAANGGTTHEITDSAVFMEGDSVLKGMAIGTPDDLDYYVASLGWKLTVDAKVGRFTDEGVGNLHRRANEVHQVVVAMLGNNYGGDQAEYANEITDMLRSFPDVREFVMFTVPEYAPKQKQVNEVLRLAAAVDKRLVLIDWEAISREVPGVLTKDGIHPTSFGAALLAQTIGITLGLAPGAPPDATLPDLGSTTRPVLPSWVNTNKGENNPANATPVAPRSTSGGGSSGGSKGTTATTSPSTSPTTARGTATTTSSGTGGATTAPGTGAKTTPAPVTTAPVSETTHAATTAPPTAPPTEAPTAAPTPAPTTAHVTSPPATTAAPGGT